MRTLNLLTFSVLIACSGEQTTTEILHHSPAIEVTSSSGGSVKRIIKADHDYKPGDKCKGGVAVYNKQGQITEEYDYSSCETLFKKVFYTYHKTGMVATSKIESDFENVTYNWKYNDQGQVTEKLATQPTESFQYKLAYNYDSLGNQIEYKGTMADKSAFHGTSRKEYTYRDGKKVKTVCYSGDNFDIPGYRIEYLYDKDSREIRNYIYKDPQTDKVDTVYVYYEYY